MRLIDANELEHEWRDHFDSCYGDSGAKMFKQAINNTPTVFDKDKVLKEINEEEKELLKENSFSEDVSLLICFIFSFVKTVIEKGGVND